MNWTPTEYVLLSLPVVVFIATLGFLVWKSGDPDYREGGDGLD